MVVRRECLEGERVPGATALYAEAAGVLRGYVPPGRDLRIAEEWLAEGLESGSVGQLTGLVCEYDIAVYWPSPKSMFNCLRAPLTAFVKASERRGVGVDPEESGEVRRRLLAALPPSWCDPEEWLMGKI